VLELGSGTGLVGLALARRVPSAEIHLTDLPIIVSNLAANVERNFPLTSGSSLASTARHASIHVFTIDWDAMPSSPETPVCERTKRSVDNARPAAYDLVIAADVLYGKEHPPLVARAAAHFLKRDGQARVVVEVPIRERAGGLVEMLKEEMKARGLQLRNEGQEEGWEEMGSEEGRVRCWWAVWEWGDGQMRRWGEIDWKSASLHAPSTQIQRSLPFNA
jgi:predicted nicotinamide N-methyase